MQRKNFVRTIEEFVCENCGAKVQGGGYTNHCPKCLYSKHVDNVPGDRANGCLGLMAPTAIEYDSGDYVIVHKCLKCGEIKRNHATQTDSFDEMVRISQQFRV